MRLSNGRMSSTSMCVCVYGSPGCSSFPARTVRLYSQYRACDVCLKENLNHPRVCVTLMRNGGVHCLGPTQRRLGKDMRSRIVVNIFLSASFLFTNCVLLVGV